MSMPHPEKETFEKVLKLKDGIQNVKERVLKLENEYLTKIEQIESQYIHNKQVDAKINELKSLKMVFLKYGDNMYPFSINNIKDNLFYSKKLLNFFTEGFNNSIKEVDIKPLHLDYIKEIITFGCDYTINQECSFDDYSSLKFYDDKVFLSLLFKIFDFDLLNTYFNFKMDSIPKKDENIIASMQLEKPDESIKVNALRAYEKDLMDSNNINKKGIFLKPNGKLTLLLNRKVKTQKLYFRMFVNATIFKNAKSQIKVEVSIDNGMRNLTLVTVPSNDNLIEVEFLDFISFNTISFSSTLGFSICYLSFYKE